MNFTLNDKIRLIQQAIPDVTQHELTIYLRSIHIYEYKSKIVIKRNPDILQQYYSKINRAISLLRKFVNNFMNEKTQGE